MGNSTCVACGECVQACPTGALMPKSIVDAVTQRGTRAVDREVHSVCPYCGVGCQITYEIKDERIAFVQGHDGPANENRLCVKGRFGFDYVTNPQRLMKPLIRRPGLPKRLDVDPSDALTHFREASWEEALDVAAKGLSKVAKKHGNKAIAGFGSAKCTNEEAYLFQKLIRTRFRNNNVDHCTRLCHASSVAALIEGIGSGAVTATFNEVEHADVIMIIGANPTENHPVAATFFKQAAKRGANLIVIDPRGVAMREYATHMLQFKPASDVALLNAIMHVIVEEGLYDVQYLQAYTEDFENLKKHVESYSPESVADICGGQLGLLATLAGLEQRDRTGQAPSYDLSMQDVAAWLTQLSWNGKAPERGAIQADANGFVSVDRSGAKVAVKSVAEVVDNPRTTSRGLMASSTGPNPWPLLGSPLRLTLTPPHIDRAIGKPQPVSPELERELGLAAAREASKDRS